MSSFAAPAAAANELPTGMWRALIRLQGQELPFNFSVEKGAAGKYTVVLHNGAERLRLDEVTLKGDSVRIVLGVFEAELRAKLTGKKLQGEWVKLHPSKPYTLPFEAEQGISYRFGPTGGRPPGPAAGRWRVTFTDAGGAVTPAVGIFEQTGDHVTGTFLTSTGDYRFLEGQMRGPQLLLSTFDGSHAYLFHATLQGENELQGEFWSGKSGHETWTAVRDESASLPDPSQQTFLKPGYERLAFTFPDLQGQPVSLSDARFAGKVVVVQLLGSWCPNCMDETAFLAPWYAANRQRGVEVIGLGFEYSPEYDKAKARLQKLQQRFEVAYPLLVAGTSDKAAAAKTLPMLQEIKAFPTTLFIDKKGKVRKIHTGFSGPGTGAHYEQFKKEFEQTIAQLLAE